LPTHDLIVLGASAGGVEAISKVVAGLPPDLPAAVCVVVHLRPYSESHLARVLERAGPLPVVAAKDDMPLRPGTIYVAVPDMHLLVQRNDGEARLRLVRGPRENRARPAVDPLFRSASLAFGPRVIAVVLSGALDDGTAGLWTVKDRGGIAIVQDPEDAAVSSMPASARDEVAVDHIASADALGPLIGRLAREPAPPAPSEAELTQRGHATDQLHRELGIVALDDDFHERSERYGEPSRFPCPECGGVLWDVSGQGPMRFQCEVGHAHSAASLAEAQTETVEAAMWAALRALEDKAELSRRRARTARANRIRVLAEQFHVEEQAAEQHAAALRALLRLNGRTGIRPKLGTSAETAHRPEHLAPNRPHAERGTGGETDPIDSGVGLDTRGG
jgi:two-component system, chemotaxis family, protein-glutamate methylesterase/glutaminase